MSKRIVEYKLHGGHIPYFIEDGGYFTGAGKLVGVTKDSDDCYIPNTLVVLNESDLKAYLGNKNMKDRDGKTLTKTQKDKVADDWLKEKGLKE